MPQRRNRQNFQNRRFDAHRGQEENERERENRDFVVLIGFALSTFLIPLLLMNLISSIPGPSGRAPVLGLRASDSSPEAGTAVLLTGRPAVKQKAEGPLNPPGRKLMVSHGILRVAPHVYSFVRLDLEAGILTDPGGNPHRDLESTFVRTIEIFVKPAPWDHMSGSEKVDLLHQTFDLLKTRYPEIPLFVKLRFGSGREDLELKFDDLHPDAA